MGNESSPKTPPAEERKKSLSYEQIQQTICSGRRVSQKQLREVLMTYFYQKAQRQSIYADYGQSDLYYDSRLQHNPSKKPHESPLNSQFYQLHNNITKKSNQNQPEEILNPKVESEIMQNEHKKQDKIYDKPTSQSDSRIPSQIRYSSIEDPALGQKYSEDLPYKKCHAQLLLFFEDFQKYKYESNFTGEVTQICNKNLDDLQQKKKLDQKQSLNYRKSKNINKNPAQSQIELFKKLMAQFLAIVERIDKRVQVELKKISQTSKQEHLGEIEKLKKHVQECEQKIQHLEGDLEIQVSLLQGFKKQVQKSRLLKQIEHAQQIKELHRIIQHYRNSKWSLNVNNKQQLLALPEKVVNCRKISENSAVRMLDCNYEVKKTQMKGLGSDIVEDIPSRIETQGYQRKGKNRIYGSCSDFHDFA